MVFPWWAQAAALCWAGRCLPARVLQPGMKMVEREGKKLKQKLVLLCVAVGILASMSWGLTPGLPQHHLHPGGLQAFVEH